MSHDTATNFYKMNFAMVQHHKWSMYDLENLIPFERQLYIDLLAQHVKAEQERIKDEMAVVRARNNRK